MYVSEKKQTICTYVLPHRLHLPPKLSMFIYCNSIKHRPILIPSIYLFFDRICSEHPPYKNVSIYILFYSFYYPYYAIHL